MPEMPLHCNSSVSISISIQWLLFQNLSSSFFNPSKLLVFITGHDKASELKHMLCDSLLQLICKPAISRVHLLPCSSWTRRVISFSLSSFSVQVLTLQISSMLILPSPLPTPTSSSSVLVQQLVQMFHPC